MIKAFTSDEEFHQWCAEHQDDGFFVGYVRGYPPKTQARARTSPGCTARAAPTRQPARTKTTSAASTKKAARRIGARSSSISRRPDCSIASIPTRTPTRRNTRAPLAACPELVEGGCWRGYCFAPIRALQLVLEWSYSQPQRTE
jgi:hypothetical protein